MCEKCGCGGIDGVDYKLVGGNIDSPGKCFDASGRDGFCGTMIVTFTTGECYCRGAGKEDTCTKSPDFFSVYKKIGNIEWTEDQDNQNIDS